MLPAPKAILFDLDDTLLDRARTFERYVPRFAARYHDSLVSYFDILGFRSAIDGCSPQEIQSVLIRMA